MTADIVRLASSRERAAVMVLERPRSIAAAQRMIREKTRDAQIAYLQALRADAEDLAAIYCAPRFRPESEGRLWEPRPPRRSLAQWIWDAVFKMGDAK